MDKGGRHHGGGRGSKKGQQQNNNNSNGNGGNPLSLLQQMNAIMQQQSAIAAAAAAAAAATGTSTTPTTNSSSSNKSSSSNNNNANSLLIQPPPPPGPPGGPSPSSSSGGPQGLPNFQSNPAAAWWYLEYLHRIQTAQMIPNLGGDQQQQQQQQETTPPPPPTKKGGAGAKKQKMSMAAIAPPPPQPQATRKIEHKRPSTGSTASSSSTQSNKRSKIMEPDVVNLSSNSSRKSTRQQQQQHHQTNLLNITLPPGVVISPSPIQTPVPSRPSASNSVSSQPPPPPAHSTPIDLSSNVNNSSSGSKRKNTEPPPPAHVPPKSHLYDHPILRQPQIGLIKKPTEILSSKGKKKSTVASLLAQSRIPADLLHHPPNSNKEICRPWLEDNKLIIPNVNSGITLTPIKNKEPSQKNLYHLPLKMGWARTTTIRHTDYKQTFDGPIHYTTPQGVKCKSMQEIKKCLNQRTAELTPRHFTFNSHVILGTYIFDFEGERVELNDNEMNENCYKKLVQTKAEILFRKEALRQKQLEEEQERLEIERKKQHLQLVRQLENLKKSKKKMKKVQKEVIEAEDEPEEVKVVDEFTVNKKMVNLEKLETCLEPAAFSNLLQIYEFLNTFGETLGFDMDSLPDLESLLKGFINQQENEEELQSILIHLIVCAVEDPGLPNPTKHLTTFNQTLKQADVNFGSLSEILRLYFEGISDSEPESEMYANWLTEAPFTCHNPKRKTKLVAYLCDILLQNKAVLKHLENSSEFIHNCKKERVQNDVKIRKLRMVLARRAVAEAIAQQQLDEGSNLSTSTTATTATTTTTTANEGLLLAVEEEEDKSLTVDDLKAKITTLQNTNEKLKKQISLNFKNIRTNSLGQDRFRRRYWNLPHSGGVFVEGGVSGEHSEELREAVRLKLEEEEEDEEEDNQENQPPPEEPPPPIEVTPPPPPPVIKIFSFFKDVCSATPPASSTGSSNKTSKKAETDDQVLLSKIKKRHWNSYYHLSQADIEQFSTGLVEAGVREGSLKDVLENVEIKQDVPHFEDTESFEIMDGGDEDGENDSVGGVDPDLVYKIHLGLIETLEGLEERVAGASLQIKNWVLPLPRNLHLSILSGITPKMKQIEILSLVKDRVLDLEQAVERRYLKPPLGKSAMELNLLSNLVGEDNANAMIAYSALGAEPQLNNGTPIGSTSSTRGQQIQENNKLREMKEKEERMQAANESKNSNSRFLTHWRESVKKTSSPSVLAMAIYLLDSSIAWDKSVMKASCQLCKGGDNEDKLLLCDACDRGYHTYCFKPPLEHIPEGDWYCWECINRATGNRGCIVCGKGNLQGKKLLACDKCVKAFHTDCIMPNVSKIPRGRWYCPDHQPTGMSSSSSAAFSSSRNSPSKKSSAKKSEGSVAVVIPPPPPPVLSSTPTAPIIPPVTTTPTSIPISLDDSTEEPVVPPPPPPLPSPPKLTKKQKKELEWCEKIVDDLMGHEEAWPFLEPVNTRQFPTYKKVIKIPMDLSTIKKGLTAGQYKSREGFLTDVRLIFDNCETFNEDDSPVGKAGHNLRLFFESLNNFNSCESNN